jgi:4-hydroxybenzoate polyprenyltransferase
MWRDIPAAVITGSAFTVVAARHHGYSLMDCAALIPPALLYFIPYLYMFNLCNQITGVEEDRANKPDRPIPSGMLSVQGAKYRWCVVTALYLLAGIAVGNVWSSIMWISVTLMLCCGGWDKHWFMKNCVSMTLGTMAMGWGAWSVVSGTPWMDWSYATFNGVVSLYAGITANVQDLREMDVDLKSGRSTMPVQFGLRESRILLSVTFVLAPVVLWFSLWTPTTVFQVVWCLAEVLAHHIIAVRLLFLDHTPLDFHHTYHFYTKTLPFTVASVVIF